MLLHKSHAIGWVFIVFIHKGGKRAEYSAIGWHVALGNGNGAVLFAWRLPVRGAIGRGDRYGSIVSVVPNLIIQCIARDVHFRSLIVHAHDGFHGVGGAVGGGLVSIQRQFVGIDDDVIQHEVVTHAGGGKVINGYLVVVVVFGQVYLEVHLIPSALLIAVIIYGVVAWNLACHKLRNAMPFALARVPSANLKLERWVGV